VTNRRLDDARLAFLRSAAYAGGATFTYRLAAGRYELSGGAFGSHVAGSPAAIARVQTAPGRYFQRPDAPHLRLDSTRMALRGAAVRAALSRVGGRHWTWGAAATAVSPGFEVNDLGFQRGADRVAQSLGVGYAEHEPGRRVRSWDVSLNQWSGLTFGGELTSFGFGASASVQLPSYAGASVGFTRALGALSTDALWGGPAIVVPARTDAWFSVYGDTRRAVSVQAYGSASREDETGAGSLGVGASVQLRPASGVDVSVGPYVYRGVDATQFLGEQRAGGAAHYLFARVTQTSVSLTTRLDATFTPALSLQVYAQPFVGAGAYSQLKEARALRARRHEERFHTFAGAMVAHDPEAYGYWVDLAGGGTRDTYVYDPSFNTKSLNATAVLRWQYRPGSSVIVVWTQRRWDYVADGSFDLARDAGRLFGVGRAPGLPATDVLAVKLSFWLGR
jgi:hypothetical protein